MDLTSLLPAVPGILKDVEEAMADHTTVACLGSMKWLGAFMCIEPVHRSLVGAATTEDEGFALVQTHRPTLLIVSQHLEQGSGLSLVAGTERHASAIKTLLIADDDNELLVKQALACGCDGICFQSDRFMPALKVVAGGGVYYPHQVSGVLQKGSAVTVMDALTDREVDVLEGLMLGLSDKQIGERLIIETYTVKTHVKNIYQKLQVDNRTQAVVKGISAGLLTLETAMAGALG